MRAEDQAQALAEGLPVDGNLSFGGYCETCDRPMFKDRCHEEQKASTWTRRANTSMCRRCHRSGVKTESPLALLAGIAGVAFELVADTAIPNCCDCGDPMRAKGSAPVRGVRARHTTDTCTACYQRRRRKLAKDRAE